MRWTAYGSSFLVGPVVVEGRPIVKIKDRKFEFDEENPELAQAQAKRQFGGFEGCCDQQGLG